MRLTLLFYYNYICDNITILKKSTYPHKPKPSVDKSISQGKAESPRFSPSSPASSSCSQLRSFPQNPDRFCNASHVGFTLTLDLTSSTSIKSNVSPSFREAHCAVWRERQRDLQRRDGIGGSVGTTQDTH